MLWRKQCACRNPEHPTKGYRSANDSVQLMEIRWTSTPPNYRLLRVYQLRPHEVPFPPHTFASQQWREGENVEAHYALYQTCLCMYLTSPDMSLTVTNMLPILGIHEHDVHKISRTLCTSWCST
uniref:Uncharacterized protein N19B2.025 n=1 Tax=Trypanosoma brucei TaxID=5691 RepID=Q8WPQ9_9TRYP|nr:hypothetical protein [Trypanosoma brucei]